MLRALIHHLRTFPEYFFALQGALLILAMGLPLYLALRYFLYRRKLKITPTQTLNFVGAYVLFAGLAFLLGSPLEKHVPGWAITTYLFFTCMAASMGVVALVDVFLLQHFLIQVKRVYISPPLRAVIKLSVFAVALLPILRYVLDFNPLALVAIPTIATAGLALALQDTLKTFIAGIGIGHIVRIGEWISFQEQEGRVIQIDWARTTLETISGERVFIPNSLLQTGIFRNFSTAGTRNRQMLKIGASYDVEPERVKEILVQCVEGASGVDNAHPTVALLKEYADSSISYGLYFSVEDYSLRFRVIDEIASRIWHAFKREGISIPYPIQTVHLKDAGEAPKRERVRNGRDKA